MSLNFPLSRCCLLGLLISSLWWFPVQAAELADTVDKVKASIVAVGTVQPARRPPAKFQATGFVVGQGRQVITNAHALPDFLDTPNKEILTVFIGQGQQFESRPAKKVATDIIHDLALLEFDGAPLPTPRPRGGAPRGHPGSGTGARAGPSPPAVGRPRQWRRSRRTRQPNCRPRRAPRVGTALRAVSRRSARPTS